jgi:hypothetical protein
MTEQEMKEWIKNAEWVDTQYEPTDSCGNEERTDIYRVGDDPQLWAVDSCNDHITPTYGDKGWDYTNYQPRKVIRTSRMVEIIEYEGIDEM